MKIKRAALGMFLLIAISPSLTVLAQTPSSPATFALTVEPSVVMARKPLTLEAILTNYSNKQMFITWHSLAGSTPAWRSTSATVKAIGHRKQYFFGAPGIRMLDQTAVHSTLSTTAIHTFAWGASVYVE